MAEASAVFPLLKGELNAKFDDVQTVYRLSNDCTAALSHIDVYFDLTNSSFVGYLVASENPTLSQVLNLSTRWISSGNSRTGYQPTNWSGYEFYGNSAKSAAVWEAELQQYSVVTAMGPDAGNCQFTWCIIAPWSGLTDVGGLGGSNCWNSQTQQWVGCVAQAGIDSRYQCYLTYCFTQYLAWTEFYPTQPELQSCSMTVNSGDLMSVDVYNHAEDGGNPQTYDIYIYDFTTPGACNVGNYVFSAMGTPHFAQYIAERAGSLPKFNPTINMQGNMYTNGVYQGIGTAYGAHLYDLYQMTNYSCDPTCHPNYNIQVSSVNGASFTQTWKTSRGT